MHTRVDAAPRCRLPSDRRPPWHDAHADPACGRGAAL